jgi:hypothetical protein
VRNTEVWIFIFIIGLLLLNWPLLEVFRLNVTEYLFIFWTAFISLIACAAHGFGAKPPDKGMD